MAECFLRDYVMSGQNIEDFLYDRGLITDIERESTIGQTDGARYSKNVWYAAFRILDAAYSNKDRKQFILDLDEVTNADSNYAYDARDDVLKRNPDLKEVYWDLEQNTTASMHTQMLANGRELITRKEGLDTLVGK